MTHVMHVFNTKAAESGTEYTPSSDRHIAEGRSSNVASGSDVSMRLALIEPRPLVRECLSRSLALATGWTVSAFPTPAAWLANCERSPASVVVACVGATDCRVLEGEMVSAIEELACIAPVAIMSDLEDPGQIVAALDRGARGYVPTSLPLHVAVEAIRLVSAGGIYVPATSLIEDRRARGETIADNPNSSTIFTQRQLCVIEALRKGKANKIIAYELNMRESTVKVHVRNIMKKLKARNRTEVAYLASEMLASAHR